MIPCVSLVNGGIFDFTEMRDFSLFGLYCHKNAAICTSFREPPSGELYTDKRETFRCFEIALKYACKITAFTDRFRCGQNDHTYFTAQKREEFHGSGGGQNIHNHFYTSK